ncbi:hypothetical protein [Pseudomonas corrugata]|uniref:hypothetical protein n=1 Tax=Pseudomonas corrugata TaxID=47879 RepID=UPI0028C4905C|nr:hypothetical protein [Pseudomonas corrugata]MDU9024396.1 hypothetical protein [Pseudomonas corrugata]
MPQICRTQVWRAWSKWQQSGIAASISGKRKYTVRAIQPKEKTFETKADAQTWARMIESEIDRGIFVSRVEAERTAFHQLIDRYISEIAPKHKGAYSEIKRLEALKRHPLATRVVATLTSSDFARYRDERLKIRKGIRSSVSWHCFNA